MFSRLFGVEKAFDAAFKPIEDGYLFYPMRWSRGYLVTEEEFQELRADYMRLGTTGFVLKAVGLLAVIAALTIIGSAALGRELSALIWITWGPPTLLAAYFFWRLMAPQRLVRGRKPIAPRRSGKETDHHFAEASTWPFLIFLNLIGVFSLMLFGAMALDAPLIGVPLALLFGWSVFRIWRATWEKWSIRDRT